MKIGIGLKKQSYTPEAYAYANYLKKKCVTVQLEDESLLDSDNDINIYFMGVHPFWQKKQGKVLEIHEYQSLSLAPFSIVKDLIKKTVNKQPVGRIFLNEIVHNKMSFLDQVPYIYRDMGVDQELFQHPDVDPEYDIVYSGSVNNRIGLIAELKKLAALGFKLLIIGDVGESQIEKFKCYDKVFFTGRVSREELPALYKKCRAGLNYTPNIYPLNIQTSTKTLEYCGAGLALISNRYEWIDNFTLKHNIKPLWLEDLTDKDIFDNWKFDSVDMSIYEWDKILTEVKFEQFLFNLM